MRTSAAIIPPRIFGDQQRTFVQALSQTSAPVLFSLSEKRILAALCAATFCIPILGSATVLQLTNKPITLLTRGTQKTALLPTGTASPGSDELAMAQYFLDKATVMGGNVDPSGERAQYLSQAQALLSATVQTGEKVETLKTQLAGLMGNPAAPILPTDTQTNTPAAPQRVAAPAGTTKAVLGTTTTSNAQSATATLKAGETSLFVPYATLKDNSQIYLTVAGNADNAVIYVKQKEAGRGFTLASTAPIRQDVVVTWYDIGTP